MAPDADATAGASQGWHDLEAVLAEEPAATLLAAYLVPLHSDYDTLAVFGYARAIFSRARCVVNIQLIRAPEPLRWRSQASISETSRSRLPIRRSRHCPRSTPISISTMLSQLACLGV